MKRWFGVFVVFLLLIIPAKVVATDYYLQFEIIDQPAENKIISVYVDPRYNAFTEGGPALLIFIKVENHYHQLTLGMHASPTIGSRDMK